MTQKRRRIEGSFSNVVTEELLLKLPAKSLQRFKCVSKQWHDRISDDAFIRAYSQYQIGDSIVVAKYKDASIKILNKNASCDQLIIKDDSIELPQHYDEYYYFQFFCSCDGILCYSFGAQFGFYYSLVLSNPNIRKHKILKVPHRTFADTYAFGYDSSIDDYKLVRISKPGILSPDSDIMVEVTPFQSNQWRQLSYDLDYFPKHIPTEQALSLNGTVYWLLYAPKRVILCFRLANETFGEIPLPDECGEVVRLLEVQGELCLLSHSNTVLHPFHHIWIMKDETWVRDTNGCYIEGGALLKTMTGTVYIHGLKETKRKAINNRSAIASAIVCANTLISP